MNMKLNKKDILLIFILISCSFLSILLLNLNKEKAQEAKVYYNNKLIKTIDLNSNNTYEVNGYNGIVKIVVKDKKIKVEDENSPLHLCSKMGYISKPHETIVCLPNKITIEIKGKSDLDTVVR